MFFLKREVSRKKIINLIFMVSLMFFVFVFLFFVFNSQPEKTNGYIVKLDSDKMAHIVSTIGDKSERYFIIGFGFTSCSAVCPLLAAKLANVMTMTDSKVFGYFVSVDLQRDDTETLNRFTKRFHNNLIGVRFNTKSELADFLSFLNSSVYQYPSGDVEHGDIIYLFDKKSNSILLYPNPQVNDLISDLKYISEAL